jgi:hypothetical protein
MEFTLYVAIFIARAEPESAARYTRQAERNALRRRRVVTAYVVAAKRACEALQRTRAAVTATLAATLPATLRGTLAVTLAETLFATLFATFAATLLSLFVGGAGAVL